VILNDGSLFLGLSLSCVRQTGWGRTSGRDHGNTQGNARTIQGNVLAVQYGMGADALAQRIGQSPIQARELLRLHRETYRVFWHWSDAALYYAMLTGRLHTVFGWQVQVPPVANDRSLRNFPMQANGAEMLRLACCLGTERGVEVCAPVHDAVLICAPLDRLDDDVARMRSDMGEASRIVLNGFELGTDATVICHPDRYMDERGAVVEEGNAPIG